MDARREQLETMLEIARRRAAAAEATLATRRREAETAAEIAAARRATWDRFEANRPQREAALRASLENRTDVRSADIFALQAGQIALSRESDALLAELKLADGAWARAEAAIEPAAAAARATRARAEKFAEALREIAAEARGDEVDDREA